jgi:cytochrome c-type biogenesis protein CcmH
MRYLFLIAFLLWITASPVWAVEHPLADPEQEARAEQLFHQIRCNICGSDSLADSPADDAAAMRQTIRVRVAAGDSIDDVMDTLTTHYGNVFILRKPIEMNTIVIQWVGPAILVFVAICFVWSGVKRALRKERY